MKEFRCFIENADIASPDTTHTSLVYELSEEGRTFAKHRERRTVKGDDKNVVHSFHVDKNNIMTAEETQLIVKVTTSFNAYLETVIIENRNNIIAGFTKFFNDGNKEKISKFSYNSLVKLNGAKYPDYFSFETDKFRCSVWLSDTTFKLFYPLYDIDVVTPFEEFDKVVKNPTEMLRHLAEFNLNKFGRRCDYVKNGFPSTYTRFLNIPYKPRKDMKEVDCWFGFNIYGAAGDYEHLMREELYDYLKDLGLTDQEIEDYFPSIFEVNEFWLLPEWTRFALPGKQNQGRINSHVTKSFVEPFNVRKFVKVYEGKDSWMKSNTYDVPLATNNLLCRIMNGYYTEERYKDFLKYYGDILTLSTTSPNFANMTTRTQNFIYLLSYITNIADAVDQTELFTKLMANQHKIDNETIRFAISSRRGVVYVSVYWDNHRYFMIPRYEYERLEK